MITLRSVTKVFPTRNGDGPVHALDGVSMSVQAGELVTVIGPSGSGKSTLLFTVGAMMRPSSGEVELEETKIYDLPARGRAELRRCRFGFVFQTFNLLPYLSSIDNVALPAILAGVSRVEARERAESMLRRLGLSSRFSHRPPQLSVGERQRVAFCRSLINRPAVLLADEPTGNLDPSTSGQVIDLLQEVNAAGQTIVLVTHDIALAERGSRVIELRDGRIATDRPASVAVSAALWLARQELSARKMHLAVSAAIVVAAVALLASTELVSRAREEAVAVQIDYMGPSFHLVPPGTTSTDLARFDLGERLIPERLVTTLRGELSPGLRWAEGRLLLNERVDGVMSRLIGLPLEPGAGSLMRAERLSPDGVLLGTDLARQLGKAARARVIILGRSWQVEGVLPPLGSAEDMAAIVTLDALQNVKGVGRSVNEIRLYAESDVPFASIATRLRSAHPELNVLPGAGRGDTAERESVTALRRYRAVAYGMSATAVAIALAIATYINAAERRIEMAMLVAMGATAGTVLRTLATRAAIIGAAGGAAGYVLGAIVAVVQDPRVAAGMGWSWVQPATAVLATMLVSTVAAIPAALQASYQSHVQVLQE